MMRSGLIAGAIAIAIFVSGPRAAHAQERPPNFGTPAAAPSPLAPLFLFVPAPAAPPSTGTAAIMTGFILLPISAILIGSSIAVWASPCGGASDRGALCGLGGASLGLTLDILGGGAFVAGSVLVPVGFVKRARYQTWQRQHGLARSAGARVRVDPLLAFGPTRGGGASGTVGIKLTF